LGGVSTNPNLPIIGSHVPEYMVQANLKFLAEDAGMPMVKREIQNIDLDESLIHSGDFLSVMRLDGVDEIIMYGTGSHSGHSVVALRIDGVLHITESQDGWYWPKHGIQRNTYKQWIQWARNADFHVSILPLKDEYRNSFDEIKALEWFETVEGLPYGYHNFLFSWIDTPDKNWPPLIPVKLLPIALAIFEKLIPSVADKFIGQALNKRMGTWGLTIPEIASFAHKKNMTVQDVMAMPEQDGWVYNDGLSYVCSCFVMGLYKAAGIVSVDVQATEFSPKDIYQINYFNTTASRPQACIDADPEHPFCQVTGKYRMYFPNYSAYEMYDHMNENCETIAPKFERTDGC
jgi:hypothetical protein